MNYYRVTCKCGHVGKGYYILKDIYKKAETGKEAAASARMTGRVKHDLKDAIVDCKQITEEEFLEGIARNKEDPYFLVNNRKDQKRFSEVENQRVKLETLEYARHTKNKDFARRKFIEKMKESPDIMTA